MDMSVYTADTVQGSHVNKETVKCIDCNTEYDLFYDLAKVTEVTSDGEEVSGYDIDQDRDPIRCVLCRKNPRSSENETLQCEDCLENPDF